MSIKKLISKMVFISKLWCEIRVYNNRVLGLFNIWIIILHVATSSEIEYLEFD